MYREISEILQELNERQRNRYTALAQRFDCLIELVDNVPEESEQFTTVEIVGHTSKGYLVAKFDTRGS